MIVIGPKTPLRILSKAQEISSQVDQLAREDTMGIISKKRLSRAFNCSIALLILVLFLCFNRSDQSSTNLEQGNLTPQSKWRQMNHLLLQELRTRKSTVLSPEASVFQRSNVIATTPKDSVRSLAYQRIHFLKQVIIENATLAWELLEDESQDFQSLRKLSLEPIDSHTLQSSEPFMFERRVHNQLANYHFVCQLTENEDESQDDHHHSQEAHMLRYVELVFEESDKSGNIRQVTKSYKAYMEPSIMYENARKNVMIRGVLVDDVFLLHKNSFSASDDESKRSIKESLAVTGTASLLGLMISYQDAQLPFSSSELETEMKMAAKFHYENSYRQFYMNKRVVSPMITLDHTLEYYKSQEPWVVLNDACAASAKVGSEYDCQNYDYYVVAIPKTFSAWIGLGYVGIPGVWLNGRIELKVTAHELGHNVGLQHASSLTSTESPKVTYGGSAKKVEYGDTFDMMGGGTMRHSAFSVRSKLITGWVKPSQIIQVNQSGTYTLFPNDDIESGGKTLALTIPFDTKNPTGAKYYVEYQRRILLNGEWVKGGGLILRMGYGEYQKGNSTFILDIVPSTETQNDAPIFIGESYYDNRCSVPMVIKALGQSCDTSLCSMQVSVEFNPQQRSLQNEKVKLPQIDIPQEVLRSSSPLFYKEILSISLLCSLFLFMLIIQL